MKYREIKIKVGDPVRWHNPRKCDLSILWVVSSIEGQLVTIRHDDTEVTVNVRELLTGSLCGLHHGYANIIIDDAKDKWFLNHFVSDLPNGTDFGGGGVGTFDNGDESGIISYKIHDFGACIKFSLIGGSRVIPDVLKERVKESVDEHGGLIVPIILDNDSTDVPGFAVYFYDVEPFDILIV